MNCETKSPATMSVPKFNQEKGKMGKGIVSEKHLNV